MIEHLILLKLQNMMDINKDLLQWFINFFYKNSSGSDVKSEVMLNQSPSDLDMQQLAE